DSFEPTTPAVPDPPAPMPGGGGGGGGGGTPAFEVTMDAGVLSFAHGSGDISFALNGTLATFTRGADTATKTVDLSAVSKITMGSGQTLNATAAQLTGRSIDGAGT